MQTKLDAFATDDILKHSDKRMFAYNEHICCKWERENYYIHLFKSYIDALSLDHISTHCDASAADDF